MKIYNNPPRSAWTELLQRPAKDLSSLRGSVSEIMQSVREGGDAKLRELTARFDKVELSELAVDARAGVSTRSVCTFPAVRRRCSVPC